MFIKIGKIGKESDIVDRNIYFINIIIAVISIFVLWQGIQIIFMTSKTKETQATIIETKFANANGTKFRNSNWALVSYKVGINTVIAKNRVQVSMDTKVGEKILVRYYKNSPEIIATFSIKKFVIGILVALVFIVVRILFQKEILK